MELKIYDTNLDLIGIIDTAKAVIWNRRYYTAGEFEVHVPANEIEIALIQKQNIVTKDGSVEFGIIENVTIEKTEEGEFIKAAGRFGSSLLARRIVFETTVLNTTFENAMRTLVNQNAIDISIGDRVIPGLELGTLNGYTETVSFQVSYRNLLTVLSGLAETSGIGFRVVLDVVNKKFKFETYKAFDRSINQSVNPRAIFSNDYDNLLESLYQTSDVEHSNVALVGGEGEGDTRKMIVLGSASGLDRYEVFVNAKSIRMTDGITEPEYFAMLAQKGAESLMPKVEYFEGNVLAEGTLIYKQDYDLGDIVTIENTKWGKRINVQITEITEVYDDNGMQITPIFGQATPTLGEVLSGKEDTSGSGADAMTPNRALVTDASGKASASAVTDTELGYLSGVTSAIQTQINSKLNSSSYTASDVLTKIKTVDGAGSGLDADLLEGLHLLGSGGIIDSGSNANGDYVKLADGTLICTVSMTVTDQAINTAYGSLYQGARTWTYPIAFVSIKVVVCSEFKYGTSASWGSVSTFTTTSASLRGYDAFSRATGTETKISAIAIGKWK